MTSSIRFTDVLYFAAELAVYVAVAWWGVTREVPAAGLVGIGSIVVMATTWSVFAAPRASIPLHGIGSLVFRLAWFGVGAAAGVVLTLGI